MDVTQAPTFVPYPVSGVSLSMYDTNYYLIRGQNFNVGKNPQTGLEPFVSVGPLPTNCPKPATCAVPPGEFCRGTVCPPFSSPFAGGCITTDRSDQGQPVVVPEMRGASGTEKNN